jgi:hypothetical protein
VIDYRAYLVGQDGHFDVRTFASASDDEAIAAQEVNPELKAQFENQAAAYRKLAADRAEKYGLPAPSAPKQELKAPE